MAKLALSNQSVQIAMRCCNNSTVNANRPAAFFFFQAEDGIRYRDVTGVQTCALPIWAIFSPEYGRKTEVRSPQTVRRQALILVSRIGRPVLLVRNFSMNCRMDVWSNTCEHTYPPRLQGDAITSGTRKPRPIGPGRPRQAGSLFRISASCSADTYSTDVSIPAETLPVSGRSCCGGTNGGT